jgi:vitamin K-dependent gamma-carboxylase-like protein
MMSPLPPRVLPYLASLGEKWHAFWFTSEPAYSLGIVRIAFGALMVYVTIDLLPPLTQLFGANGPLPSQPTTEEFRWVNPYTYGIFQIWTSDTALVVGWAILLLSAVALLVGWHSRLAAVLVWVLFLSFVRRNPSVFNFGDDVIGITALILMLSACGAALSLDQRRRSGRFWSAECRSRWPVRLVQVQLSLIYFFSAVAKLRTDEWNEGSAVSFPWRSFHDWAILPAPGWLAENPVMVNAVTWGTLVLEFALAILVWNPRLRYWLLGAGVVLHVLIWLTLPVMFFSLAMFVLYLSWAPWQTVRDLPDSLSGLRRRWSGRGKTPGATGSVGSTVDVLTERSA